MLTRRAALKGGTAAACAAAAGMVAVPMLAAQSNPDARVFALIEDRGCVMDRRAVVRRRCYYAIKAALPSHLRSLPADELFEVPGATDTVVALRKRPEIQAHHKADPPPRLPHLLECPCVSFFSAIITEFFFSSDSP